MTEDEIIASNYDALCTTTTIHTKVSPDAILSALKIRKTTGELTFRLNEGGIRQIVLNEQTRMTEAERDQIREILGME